MQLYFCCLFSSGHFYRKPFCSFLKRQFLTRNPNNWTNQSIKHKHAMQHCIYIYIYIYINKENCRQTAKKLVDVTCLARSICVYFGS